MEETKLTLDVIEVHILSEDSWLNPLSSESALKVSNKGRNHNRNKCYTYWHWINSGHSSSDTHTYQNWAKELQRGGGGKWKGKDKDKDKANVSEDPLKQNSGTSEHVNLQSMYLIP